MSCGLEVLERNTRAQAQLIDDLLDVSRIVNGQLRLDIRQVELVPVIEAALDAVRLAAEAKGIVLRARLDPAAGPISGDPTRLQQVVWNLLNNAVKFTPSQGQVEITLERAGPRARLTVRDTGQGIAPDFLPHAFERFRQADSTSTRSHSGLGLGLAIVRHLVELHGGTVRADSAGENQGAVFVVELPLLPVRRETAANGPAAPAPPAARQGRLEPRPSLQGLRVLVVDDEEDARDMVAVALAQCGVAVTAAASAEEALTLLPQVQPQVLLSDIGMPGQDGYSLIQKVRQLPAEQCGRVPAAALTAYARAEDRTRALVAGFQTHIPKPVDPAELAAVVESLAQWNMSGELPAGSPAASG
jgi:CheY-like chemotaxis protein